MQGLIEKISDKYLMAKDTLNGLWNDITTDPYEMSGARTLAFDALNELLGSSSISSLLPYECYDPEQDIYYNKDSIGFVLEILPLCGLDSAAFDSFVNLVNEKLPGESLLHFLMVSSTDIDSQLKRFEEHRGKAGGIYEKLSKKRTEHIREKNKSSVLKSEKYVFKNYSLYIDVTIPCDEGADKLQEIKKTLKSVLEGISAKHRLIDPSSLSEIVNRVISPNYCQENKSQINPLDPINVQCHEPGTSLKVGKSAIYLNEGESVIRCCSIKDYPNYWMPEAMGDMIGDAFKSPLRLGFPFVMSCSIFVPKQDGIAAKYTTKRANSANAAKGLGKYSRKTMDTAKDLDFMMKLNEEGQKLVKVSFDYLVFGDEKSADDNYSTLQAFLDAKKWRHSEAKYTQLHGLIRAFPMALSSSAVKAMEKFSSFKTLPAQTALNLIPMQGEPNGYESPAMMFGGRRGQVCFWDPFTNQQGNYNVIVAASSGAGKSVFNQEYILSHLSSGGRAWIIDVGRSYYKLTKLLGGQFIEFTGSSKISLNPFSDIDDIKDKDAGYMDILKPLVAQMASPKHELSPIQLSAIEKAIFDVWDRLGNDMTITDVANQLQSVPDSRANDLGKMLFPYTATGMYGHYFEGKSSFKFDSKLVCLELEELRSKEDLKSVVLMLLMFQMTQSMYLGDRVTRSTCLIDEAWDMLKNIQGSSFIETGCRRARKYNGNFVICTQSINDCFDNKASLEAYNNSDWTVILRHKDSALDSVVGSKRLDLTPHSLKLAKSLENKSGDFSEALIKGPGGTFLGRSIYDPFSIELYSTKASDFSEINALIKSGASMEEALDQMVMSKKL